MPLPKCVHSVIRLQVLPPRDSSSTMGEVSILTEPKMLALPGSTFTSPPISFSSSRISGQGVREADWEDGEDPRAEESDDELEDEGDWLEGRFQG